MSLVRGPAGWRRPSRWSSVHLRLLAFLVVLAAVAAPGQAEFLRLDVTFEGIGCASCIESLERRLLRMRGVEQVEVDTARGLATLRLEPENRVRLESVISRITQDGTKVLRTRFTARGTILQGDQGPLFEPSGLKRTYRLQLGDQAVGFHPSPGVVYEVRGVAPASEPGAQPVIAVESIPVQGVDAEPAHRIPPAR